MKFHFFRQLRGVPQHLWIIYIGTLFLTVFLIILFAGDEPKPIFYPPTTCRVNRTIKHTSPNDITFITVPRPVLKQRQTRKYKLAFSSWLAASPSSKVILFVNKTQFDPTGAFPDELDHLFGANRVNYAGLIRSDLDNVPYLDDWFRQGILETDTKYICFINSDILLSSNWMRKVRQIIKKLDSKPFVIIGQRIDFKLTNGAYDKLRFDQKHLLDDIDLMVNNSLHEEHSHFGIDFFVFRADVPPFDVEKFPPFIIGRYNWDNWFVGWLNKIAETVTLGLDPPVYHIDHPRHNFDRKDARVSINHHLRQANGKYFGDNSNTKWKVKGDRLVGKQGQNLFLFDD